MPSMRPQSNPICVNRCCKVVTSSPRISAPGVTERLRSPKRQRASSNARYVLRVKTPVAESPRDCWKCASAATTSSSNEVGEFRSKPRRASEAITSVTTQEARSALVKTRKDAIAAAHATFKAAVDALGAAPVKPVKPTLPAKPVKPGKAPKSGN